MAKSYCIPAEMENPSKNAWMNSPVNVEMLATGETITSLCVSSPKWRWPTTVCSKK